MNERGGRKDGCANPSPPFAALWASPAETAQTFVRRMKRRGLTLGEHVALYAQGDAVCSCSTHSNTFDTLDAGKLIGTYTRRATVEDVAEDIATFAAERGAGVTQAAA